MHTDKSKEVLGAFVATMNTILSPSVCSCCILCMPRSHFPYIHFWGLSVGGCPNGSIIAIIIIVIKCFRHLIAQYSTPALHPRPPEVFIWEIVMPCLAYICHVPCGSLALSKGDFPLLLSCTWNLFWDFHSELFLKEIKHHLFYYLLYQQGKDVTLKLC